VRVEEERGAESLRSMPGKRKKKSVETKKGEKEGEKKGQKKAKSKKKLNKTEHCPRRYDWQSEGTN
jgi:hypothetical protein